MRGNEWISYNYSSFTLSFLRLNPNDMYFSYFGKISKR